MSEDVFSRLGIDPNKGGRGEYARLFPTLSEKGKEGRATSIFLSALARIPELADTLLTPLGRKIGSRSSVRSLIEVEFPKADTNLRPDGLITVRTGKSDWTCLVESKVAGTLETKQVESYLRLARSLKLDAVLTISNDIVPRPDIPAVPVNGTLTRSVGLYHYSWMQILSQLQLLASSDRVSDSDHSWVIDELIRFLDHPSTGIQGFTQMPQEWGEIIEAVRGNRSLRRGGDGEASIVAGWMQEERELAMILSNTTRSSVKVDRNRAETAHGSNIAKRHLTTLVDNGFLSSSLSVPDAAAPVVVCLDLNSRSIRYSMEVRAPQDKKRATASINWLLRQLPKECDDRLTIHAIWKGNRQNTYASVDAVRANPENLIPEVKNVIPTRFAVEMTCELGRGFSSRKMVIKGAEDHLIKFYENVGQHLASWTAAAPKARQRTVAEELEDSTSAQ